MIKDLLNKIINTDALSGFKQLPDNCLDMICTSPPYYGLRNYSTKPLIWDGLESCEHEWQRSGICKKCDAWKGELGLEPTPELFIKHLVGIFAEARRALKPCGTLWVNIGDSYWGGKGNSGHMDSDKQANRAKAGESLNKEHAHVGGKNKMRPTDGRHDIIKPKDLIGIPWMLAFALRADGWYLRQDIIWNKPNPMPESVTDRCTKSHEYIFLLSKSRQYYYDAEAIKTPIADASIQRLMQDIENQEGSTRVPGKTNGRMKAVGASPNGIVRDRLLDYNSKEKLLRDKVKRGGFEKESELPEPSGLANKKSVWTITTKPFTDAHFATFPEELPEICIKAGSSQYGCCPQCGAPWQRVIEKKGMLSGRDRNHGGRTDGKARPAQWDKRKNPTTTIEKGWIPTCYCHSSYEGVAKEEVICPAIVCDPFSGSNTTGATAQKLGRDFISFELNPEYIKIANKRMHKEFGLFLNPQK